MPPRCLASMLKIDAWWIGAIWSPKKLFLGFSFPFGLLPRIAQGQRLFLSGMKILLMSVNWQCFWGFIWSFPHPSSQISTTVFLKDFACAVELFQHDPRISVVKAESQEGTWTMDDPQSQGRDDLSFDNWGTIYRNLLKRRCFFFLVCYMFVIPEWDKGRVSCTPFRNEPWLPRNKSATFWSNWIQWSKEWFMQS